MVYLNNTIFNMPRFILCKWLSSAPRATGWHWTPENTAASIMPASPTLPKSSTSSTPYPSAPIRPTYLVHPTVAGRGALRMLWVSYMSVARFARRSGAHTLRRKQMFSAIGTSSDIGLSSSQLRLRNYSLLTLS